MNNALRARPRKHTRSHCTLFVSVVRVFFDQLLLWSLINLCRLILMRTKTTKRVYPINLSTNYTIWNIPRTLELLLTIDFYCNCSISTFTYKSITIERTQKRPSLLMLLLLLLLLIYLFTKLHNKFSIKSHRSSKVFTMIITFRFDWAS